MTRFEQQRLALELSESFQYAYLCAAANAPEYWSGSELRELLVDVAREKFALVGLTRKQRRAYENDRTINPGL